MTVLQSRSRIAFADVSKFTLKGRIEPEEDPNMVMSIARILYGHRNPCMQRNVMIRLILAGIQDTIYVAPARLVRPRAACDDWSVVTVATAFTARS